MGVSPLKVKRLLSLGEGFRRADEELPGASRDLEERHISYLTSAETLEKIQPNSLLARCQLFQDAFPEKKLSYYRLRKIYAEHNVVQRDIKALKAMTSSQLSK